jgi:general secretion pathway protein G
MKNQIQKGFTLLEILLVIAAIGILAAIVIVAINPNRQLSQVRDTERRSDVNALSKAMEQYLIDYGSYPTGITNEYQPVCNDAITTDCIDLSGDLISTYLADVPEDPDPTNPYYIAINPENNKISVIASGAEMVNEVSVNKFVDLRTINIDIDNSSNGNTLTDYQVPVTLSYQSGMESDFSDVRFRNASGQELDFWLENLTANTQASFWIEVDSIVASAVTRIQAVYYDTEAFVATSSVAETFIPDQIYLESRVCNNSTLCNYTDNNNEFEQLISSSPALLGSGYVNSVDQGINPYGSDDNYFLRYRMLFVPDVTGAHAFRVNSDDASEVELRGVNDTNSSNVIAHWYGGHGTSSGCNTGGTQGSRNFTAGVPVWLDYRMNEWEGGQLARMCVNDGLGYQVFSATNFPGQIFARQFVNPEPSVTVN